MLENLKDLKEKFSNSLGLISFNTIESAVDAKKFLIGKKSYRYSLFNVNNDIVEDNTDDVTIDTDGTVSSYKKKEEPHHQVILQGENSFLREYKPVIKAIQSGSITNIIDLEKNYIEELIKIRAPYDVIEGWLACRVFVYNNELFVVNNYGRKTITSSKDGRKLENLPNGAVEYIFFGYSKSDARQGKSTWIKKSVITDDSVLPSLNRHMLGFWDAIKDVISVKDAIKACGRIGQFFTPNKQTKEYYTIGVYDNYFDAVNTAIIKENGIEKEVYTGVGTDGKAYCSEDLIGDVLKVENKGLMRLGIHFQGRPFNGGAKPHVGPWSKECCEEWHKLRLEENDRLIAKGKKPTYRVYGPKEIPDIFVDANVVKGKYKISDKGTTINMMSISKETKSKFNKQIALKLFALGNPAEVMEWIYGLAQKQFNKLLDAIPKQREVKPSEKYGMQIAGAIDPKNPAAGSKKLSDFIITAKNTINKLSFEIEGYNLKLDPDMGLAFGVRLLKEGEVFINNNSLWSRMCAIFKMPSMFDREFYLAKVVTPNTIVARINKLCAEGKITSKMAIGLSKQVRGYAKGMIMLPGYAYILAIIAGSDYDWDGANVIFDKFVVDLLQKSLEEVDCTDGQKISIDAKTKVYNQSVLKLGEQEETFKKNDKNFVFKVFLKVLRAEGWIGIITMYNDIMLSLLALAKNNKLNACKLLMKERFGDEGTAEYLSPIENVNGSLYVSEIQLVEALKRMANSKWNKENFVRFFSDMSKIFRLYQETAIDAATTGVVMSIKFVVDSMKILSHIDMQVVSVAIKKNGEIIGNIVRGYVVVNKNDKTYKHRILKEEEDTDNMGAEYITVEGKKVYIIKTSKIDRIVPESRKVKIKRLNLEDGKMYYSNEKREVSYIDDYISQTQQKIANRVNEDYSKLCASQDEKLEYSSELVSKCITTLRSLSSKEKIELFLLKDIYTKLSFSLIMAQDEDDDTAALFKDAFASISKCLGNSILRKYDDMKEDIGRLVLGVTMSFLGRKNDEGNRRIYTNSKSKNRFAYSILNGHTMNAITEGEVYAKASVIQGTDDCIGETIYFQDAVGVDSNGNTVVIDDKYTGLLDIVKEGNKLVAQKLVEFPLEEIDNKVYVAILRENKELKNLQITENSVLFVDEDGIVNIDVDSQVEEDPIVLECGPTLYTDISDDSNYYINAITPIEIDNGSTIYVLELQIEE